MKFIRNNIAFIETDDIRFLGLLPNHVATKLKEFHDDNFQLEKFMDNESLTYFINQESIIDYDTISSLSSDEIKAKIKEIETKITNSNNEAVIKSLRHILLTLNRYEENRDYYDQLANRLCFKRSPKKVNNKDKGLSR